MTRRTRLTTLLLLAALLSFPLQAAGERDNRRSRGSTLDELLSRWVTAAFDHEPGVVDALAVLVGSWSRADLQRLLPWATALVELLPASDKRQLEPISFRIRGPRLRCPRPGMSGSRRIPGGSTTSAPAGICRRRSRRSTRRCAGASRG